MIFRKIFNFFTNVGIDESLNDDLVKRVKMHNMLGFVSSVLMFIFPLLFIYYKIYEGFYLTLIGTTTLLAPLILNYFQHFVISRFVAGIAGTFTFICGIIMFGYDSGFIYGLIALMCVPILFFKENKYRLILYVSNFSMGLILYLLFSNSIPFYPLSDGKLVMHITLLVMNTILIVMYFISSSSINEFYEKKNLALVEQLTHRNEELKNFSYSTSHDLKQPLRTILNFISVLKKKKSHQLDKDGQHFLELIENSGIRLDELIDALLSHSVLGQTMSFEKFDAGQLVDVVLADLEIMIKENKAKVSVSNLPMVVANRQEIGAVFQNLITNALKFRKETISPVIQISALDDGLFWRFIIRDNGIGIEENIQEKVFQMFQKGHLNPSFQGTGIGLANCKKIVEHHSGKIWIESKVNQGSSFSFTILKAPNAVNYN